MPTPEQNKETVRRFMDEVMNHQKLEVAEEMFADDFVEHSPLSPDMGTDKKAALETFRAMFVMSPDAKAELVNVIATENKVAIHSRYTGTDNGIGWGSMMDAPPTGKSFSIEGIDVVTVNDEGKYTEH